MKKIVCTILVLVSVISYSQTDLKKSETPQQENLIVGEWFPLNTSKGGLGSGFTLTADGKRNSVFGAYVAFEYKLRGDSLALKIPNGKENWAKSLIIPDTNINTLKIKLAGM